MAELPVTRWRELLRENWRRLIGWWLGEIRQVLPVRLRQRLERREQRLVIRVDGRWASIWLHDGERCEELDLVDLDSDGKQLEAVRARAVSASPQLAEQVVMLPEHLVLQRTLLLPFETEDRLADVLRFEMDRLTPFKADQVYCSHILLGRDKLRRVLQVRIAVIRRGVLDPLLDRLVGAGFAPNHVTVGGPRPAGDKQIDLLPESRRVSAPARNGRLHRSLLILAAALAVAVVTLPLVYRGQTIEDLQAQLAEVKATAEGAEQTGQRIESLVRQTEVFAERRGARPTVVELLNELTHTLPDDTWLSRLELSGGQLRIQGESASVSSLIRLIEDTIFFRSVNFSAPVTRNPRNSRDRFTLQAEIETEAATP